jgi:uncharacterized protein DUF4440
VPNVPNECRPCGGWHDRGVTCGSSDADAVSHLLDAERLLQRAVLTGDVALLDRLLDDDVLYTGPDGVVLDKQTDLESHRSGNLRVTALVCEDLSAATDESHGTTEALLTVAGIASGEPFSARLRYIRTWRLNPGRLPRVIRASATEVR